MGASWAHFRSGWYPIGTRTDAATTHGRVLCRFVTRVQKTVSELGRMVADWRFPESPLVSITLDGEPLAAADYLVASASAHWFVDWEDHPRAREQRGQVALISLVGHVPEEVDADDALRTAVLEAALGAVAAQLTHKPQSV